MSRSFVPSLLAGCALIAPAAAQITISDANAVYSQSVLIASQSESPASNFSASGSDHLFEDGWYFYIAGDANETAMNSVGMVAASAGTHGDLDWANVNGRGLIAVGIDFDVRSTDATSGYIAQAYTVTNISAGSLGLSVLHYVDLDVSGTVNTAQGPGFRQVIGNVNSAEKFAYQSWGANAWTTQAFSGTECGITTAGQANLSNSGLPFSGDYSGAMQWNVTLAPGASYTARVRIGHNKLASTDNYGAGNNGTFGLATMSASVPAIGLTSDVTMSNAHPMRPGLMLFGLGAQAQVITPDHTLLLVPFIDVSILTDGLGQATVPVAIPLDPAIVGAKIQAQGWFIDTGAPLAIAHSDAVRLTVGL